MVRNKGLGKKGESLAAKLLRNQGYNILKRYFHYRFGEINIVATEKDTLVFVEVKTRTSREFGLLEEAITAKKLKSIQRVGQIYRAANKDFPAAERIDVVAIEMNGEGKVVRKEIIKNASTY